MTHLENLFTLTNHQDPHVPHPKELLEQRGEGEPHLQSLELFLTLSDNSLFSVSVSVPSCHTCTYQLSVSALHCTVVLCTLYITLGHVIVSLWPRQVSPGPSYCTNHTCEASSRDHLQGTDTIAVYLLALLDLL